MKECNHLDQGEKLQLPGCRGGSAGHGWPFGSLRETSCGNVLWLVAQLKGGSEGVSYPSSLVLF